MERARFGVPAFCMTPHSPNRSAFVKGGAPLLQTREKSLGALDSRYQFGYYNLNT